MSLHLLDVNVMVALHLPEHEAHSRVFEWFLRTGRKSFCTCALTQAGFLRMMMNPVLTGEKITLNEAQELLDSLVQQSGHGFLQMECSFREAAAPFEDRIFGHRQITDAYLLGLAMRHKAKLATLDKAIVHLAGQQLSSHLALIQ
ncbi:TA system VapC family ribonuclease toxin [Paracidobacterium acidisoli]|uniref:Ribonuclease VapC n=1 Tax=Paracidobacterium acidisoli TaxID=2303751 RepID=A0A372IR68_9BACT|nr:TA system VapC family ribonuclease toxin [Paracidobacterium acidisoli]MBT9330272.1 PIN domain-containing protein [Paracidobacterium acidisoli]